LYELPLSRDVVYVLEITYQSGTWQDIHLKDQFDNVKSLWPQGSKDGFGEFADLPHTSGILHAAEGLLSSYHAPGRYGYGKFVKDGYVDSNEPWPERLGSVADNFAAMLMERILDERFGEWDG
jgi:hypothetical protein